MSYRTDLAAESACLQSEKLPEGITSEIVNSGKIEIQRITISSENAAKNVGKPTGKYITITLPSFSSPEEITEEETVSIADEISSLLPDDGLVLVIGLGNNSITPDAIGPRTVHKILATRHINGELARANGLDDLRATAALSPGVLGQTGMETSEIVSAVVQQINPAAVIVIDALAARNTARLGCTIQVSNSGISPGSGVMNARKELSSATLGVPVVSVGVPTVVDASTLARDLISEEEISPEQQHMFEVNGSELMITPREIDQLIDRACKTLSLAINKALQPQLTLEEIAYLAN